MSYKNQSQVVDVSKLANKTGGSVAPRLFQATSDNVNTGTAQAVQKVLNSVHLSSDTSKTKPTPSFSFASSTPNTPPPENLKTNLFGLEKTPVSSKKQPEAKPVSGFNFGSSKTETTIFASEKTNAVDKEKSKSGFNFDGFAPKQDATPKESKKSAETAEDKPQVRTEPTLPAPEPVKPKAGLFGSSSNNSGFSFGAASTPTLKSSENPFAPKSDAPKANPFASSKTATTNIFGGFQPKTTDTTYVLRNVFYSL